IHVGNHYVRVNQSLFLCEVVVYEKNGRELKLGIDQIGPKLLEYVFNDLSTSLNSDSFPNYLEKSTKLLNSTNIDIEFRSLVFLHENNILNNKWIYLSNKIAEEESIKCIEE